MSERRTSSAGWTLGPDGRWVPPPPAAGVNGLAQPMPPRAPEAWPTSPTGHGPGSGPAGPWAGVSLAAYGPDASPDQGHGRRTLALLGTFVLLGVVLVVAVGVMSGGGPLRPAKRLSPAHAADPVPARAEVPDGSPEATLSAKVALQVAAEFEAEGWNVRESEPLALGAPPDTCHPEGWAEGATDRFRVTFKARGIGTVEIRTMAYGSHHQARADLDRISGEQFRACLEAMAEGYLGSGVRTEALPDDPATPGITYRSRPTRGSRVQDDTFIVVGQVRAYVTYCTCRGMDAATRGAIAREIARAMSDSQGLTQPT